MDRITINNNHIINIGNVLNDAKRPLKERFRALFSLRNIGGSCAIQQIERAFSDSSDLLKHELAYCLGQMQDPEAVAVLSNVINDYKQAPIVRHEAGEALGAIGVDETIPLLQKYSKDVTSEVRETCELAIERIRWLHDGKYKEKLSLNPFHSTDPAPPAVGTNISELKSILLDENASLFNRYRAMFSLRNINTQESILAICDGLSCSGNLFKHEIAFVLGQLQNELSVPYLIKTLKDLTEHEMVRHECAEALGAIATDECISILNKYLNDEKRVVRESCEIALDMCEYENSPEFQYANGLQMILS